MTIFTIEAGTGVFNFGYSLWEEVEEIVELLLAGDFGRAVPLIRSTIHSIPQRIYFNIPIIRGRTDILLDVLNSIFDRVVNKAEAGVRASPVLREGVYKDTERPLNKTVRLGGTKPKVRV